eukprot:Skav229138  [mRNA]  locus=scaffold1875:108963:113778:+ [translate_table: standard]
MASGDDELLQWLEERLKEERDQLERSHVVVLAQMQSMLPQRPRAGRFQLGGWRKLHAKKMNNFFQYTDHSRETPITRAEWKRVMERDDARHWFGAQGLPIRDPDMIFNLIDTDNSDSISMEELISGVSQLQGVASGVDVAVLKRSQSYLVALAESTWRPKATKGLSL